MKPESEPAPAWNPRVGLCARCQHAEVVTSMRGTVFYLCGLSAMDPAFPKYPVLPVISCAGFADVVPLLPSP